MEKVSAIHGLQELLFFGQGFLDPQNKILFTLKIGDFYLKKIEFNYYLFPPNKFFFNKICDFLVALVTGTK
jgi:hypothetical protein